MPNFGLLPAIISCPKTITQWFCGMLRNLRMSQFGVRFCIGGGANFMRRRTGGALFAPFPTIARFRG